LVLSGPLQNPLGKTLDCGGQIVENAYSVSCGALIANSFASPTGSGIEFYEGVYSSATLTATNLYVGNPFANPPAAIGTVYDTVYNLPPGSTPPTISQVLTAGSVASGGQSITVPSATFDDLTISDILTIGTVDPSGDTAGILRVSKIQAVLPTAGGDAATLNFDITNVSFDEITVQGSATFTQDVLTPLLKVGQITTNSPGDDMTLTGILSGGGTATITGMSEVAGTDIKGATGSFTSIENISNNGPPQLSFGVDVNNHDISNIQNLEMFIDATNDIKIKANVVNPSTNYPSLGLTWTDGANPAVTSIVYDTVFNVPPSVAANSLSAILANNNSAGGNDITDGGDFTCTKLITSDITSDSASVKIFGITEYIEIPSVEHPVEYITFIQATDSALQVQYGHLINVPTPGGPWGAIYDSHYNPPTAVCPINYTNSSGLDFNFSIPGNIFNQKLVTFTLGQGIGNIFTLYIENFAFETKAPITDGLNYVLYLDSSDMPVGNYFPGRTDKPLSYLTILDVTEAAKNFAFTQSILQTDIGESTGTVSLWVGATINTGPPLASFNMDFISLLGTLESTNSIGTTVTYT